MPFSFPMPLWYLEELERRRRRTIEEGEEVEQNLREMMDKDKKSNKEEK